MMKNFVNFLFKLYMIVFLLFIGIVTDTRLTRNIEAIEDAIGNEVYYFFSKIDQEQINHQTDFDDERM